jgi:hypothetical protein
MSSFLRCIIFELNFSSNVFFYCFYYIYVLLFAELYFDRGNFYDFTSLGKFKLVPLWSFRFILFLNSDLTVGAIKYTTPIFCIRKKVHVFCPILDQIHVRFCFYKKPEGVFAHQFYIHGIHFRRFKLLCIVLSCPF